MKRATLGMLGADASSPTAKLGYGSSAYLHTVAEAMRFSLADRVRVVGDPDLDPTGICADRIVNCLERVLELQR